jgi:hypothetical protein
MNLKNKIRLVVMASLFGFAGLAFAGKQGISFYGGLGLSALQPNKDAGVEYDPAFGGNAFLGIEEDGWSLEYLGLITVDTGTNFSNTEYAVSGGVASLGYRTLETRAGLYFLLSVGAANFDVTTSTPASEVVSKLSGNTVTIGMGMRLDKTERMELDYSLARLESDSAAGSSSNTHMFTLRYLWGGNPYDPRF